MARRSRRAPFAERGANPAPSAWRGGPRPRSRRGSGQTFPGLPAGLPHAEGLRGAPSRPPTPFLPLLADRALTAGAEGSGRCCGGGCAAAAGGAGGLRRHRRPRLPAAHAGRREGERWMEGERDGGGREGGGRCSSSIIQRFPSPPAACDRRQYPRAVPAPAELPARGCQRRGHLPSLPVQVSCGLPQTVWLLKKMTVLAAFSRAGLSSSRGRAWGISLLFSP